MSQMFAGWLAVNTVVRSIFVLRSMGGGGTAEKCWVFNRTLPENTWDIFLPEK